MHQAEPAHAAPARHFQHWSEMTVPGWFGPLRLAVAKIAFVQQQIDTFNERLVGGPWSGSGVGNVSQRTVGPVNPVADRSPGVRRSHMPHDPTVGQCQAFGQFLKFEWRRHGKQRRGEQVLAHGGQVFGQPDHPDPPQDSLQHRHHEKCQADDVIEMRVRQQHRQFIAPTQAGEPLGARPGIKSQPQIGQQHAQCLTSLGRVVSRGSEESDGDVAVCCGGRSHAATGPSSTCGIGSSRYGTPLPDQSAGRCEPQSSHAGPATDSRAAAASDIRRSTTGPR